MSRHLAFSPASLRPILFSLALALLFCGNAVAQCDSLTSGSFNVAANWSCGFVPGSTNTVRVFHTITSTTDVGVDSLDIFPGAALVMDGFPLEIEIRTLVVHPGGLLSGGANSSIYITAPPGAAFDITNDGTIQAGATGGDVFIHDGGPGGDLPCPSGSRVTATGGTFRAAPPDGNVYILAGEVHLVDSHVEAGSGNVPYNLICSSVAGSVYIAGTTVVSGGTTQIYQGLNSNSSAPPAACPTSTREDGSVNVLALSCDGTGGDLIVGGHTVVGHPMAISPSQCTTVFGSHSVIADTATVNGSGNGCIYWDPPLLELAGDATLKAGDITVAGEDLDATGLANRTLPTPALDATGTLEIRLEPGGELDLQGLTPGFDYFQAGRQIVIAADRGQILTDRGVALGELMSPAPELVPFEPAFVVSLNPGSVRQVTPGSIVELPLVIANLSSGVSLTCVNIVDAPVWFGGPITIEVELDSGEAIIRTLTLEVPADAAPGDFAVLKVSAMGNGEGWVTSTHIFEVTESSKGPVAGS